MATKQTFTETWKESTQYEQTAALLAKAQDAEDAASIVRVALDVATVDQDGRTNTERVFWSRHTEEITEADD